GWKIGCTTKVMQAYLNIDSPCAGTMFQASTWHGRHAFAVPLRGRLGVECEIAVRLARYVDYPSLDTPTLIADDFFHHACVLGPPSESMRPESLRDVTASMTINGLQVGRGAGTDILGEPLQVLCWLANNAAAWGTPLLAGDVILLGSLVQTQWVQAGDAVTVTNDPLGEVAADFRGPARLADAAPLVVRMRITPRGADVRQPGGHLVRHRRGRLDASRTDVQ